MSNVSVFDKANVTDWFGQPEYPSNPPVGESRMFYDFTTNSFHVIDSNGEDLLGGTFGSLASGTNTTAALVIGTGASLSFSGTGTVNANELTGITISGVPSVGQVLTATSPTAAVWQTPSGGGGGSVVLTAVAPTVTAGQIGLGSTTNFTIGANGGAAGLTALPVGYIVVNVGGTAYQVPYYNI